MGEDRRRVPLHASRGRLSLIEGSHSGAGWLILITKALGVIVERLCMGQDGLRIVNRDMGR